MYSLVPIRELTSVPEDLREVITFQRHKLQSLLLEILGSAAYKVKVTGAPARVPSDSQGLSRRANLERTEAQDIITWQKRMIKEVLIHSFTGRHICRAAVA